MFDSGEKRPFIIPKENKNPSIARIPNEVIQYMSNTFLGIKHVSNLSQTCKGAHALFKTTLVTAKAQMQLFYAMYGEFEELKKLLMLTKSDSECAALKRIQVIEECGRAWEAVSPLEFAAWAGDTSIVTILLGNVPDKDLSKALNQLLNVQKNGLEGRKFLEPYCSLIDGYDVYISKFNNYDTDELCTYWVQIGKLQYMLPIVGLQYLCDKVPFYPIPSFELPPLRSVNLHDGSSLLPLAKSGLGDDCAIFKGWENVAALHTNYGFQEDAEHDCAAFRQLCKVKIKALADIIDELQKHSLEMRLSAP